MAVIPSDWSVVILGRWNRAILTPSGIARRLFELEQDTPVEVLVAIDAIAPPQVKHDRMVVVAGNDRLIIQPDDSEYPKLARAMELGARALEELPETPLAAVGVNVKFVIAEPIEALQAVTKKTEFDNRLSENDFVICGRSMTRTLNWRGGRINLTIREEQNGSFDILFNFELHSTEKDRHVQWLKTDVKEIEKQVNSILDDCIRINDEDHSHVADA
jgi:hypothetical protein